MPRDNFTQWARNAKGPIAWMTKNTVAANLLMFVIFIGGFIGMMSTTQEIFPDFELDMVTVSVPYPGASPAEVEQGIVLALEEAVRGLDGVKRVTSSSNEGVGTISIELLLDTDGDKALNDVKSAVDSVLTLPEEAERPRVRLLNNRRQVVNLVISGPQDLSTLHELAEKARFALLEHEDITQISVSGIPPLEVSVEIPRETLESYGLTMAQVAAQIRAASLELPGGELETTGGELLVRLSDRRLTAHEFENIIIRSTQSGHEVRLSDIATVRDGYMDTDSATFFNGEPGVMLTAYRVGDETPTKVANAVKEYAEILSAELPANMSVTVWNDGSEMLEGRIDLLLRNAQAGLILVLLILALFLDIRLAGWVALGIPISFLGAFLVMPVADITINMVTLFAFIITLGMVVDDAIVVGENIYTRVQQGADKVEAAIAGAQEMAVPVTFSILTTVAAFSPLFFVPGFMGKIFKMIPAIVISVLFFSLLESFLILPAHLSHVDPESEGGILAPLVRFQQKIGKGLESFIHNRYEPFLRLVLRWRYVAMAFAVASFIVTISMVANGIVAFNFFPKLEGDQVTVSARLPFGAAIERTEEVQRILEEAGFEAKAKMGGEPYFRGMLTQLGQGAPTGRGTSATGSHLVSVTMSLVPGEDRSFTAAEFSNEWSKNVPNLPGVESLLFNFSTGPGAGAAVSVQLAHADTEVLAKVSGELAETLRGYSDLTDVENGYAAGKPQLNFHLLPQANTLGLTGNDIARQLRSNFFGAEALREQRGRNEVRVMVRLPPDQRQSEFDIESMLVRTPMGGHVPLASVATFDRGISPTNINREEGKRIVQVSAELAKGVASPQGVLNNLNKDVFPRLTQDYPGLDISMVGSQREQQEAFSSLGRNYILALFVMFALLAIPFKSYSQPLIIMSAIPFGFVGAVAGHILMGFEMSIISMMGIVALSGVVVNDSLVLIDAANKKYDGGADHLESIIYGGTRRFRPILLTSLTTFFGLAPMILETSVQARFLIPMAISLGFGVLFATFVVLLLVPCAYMILEDVGGLFSSIKQRLFGGPKKETPPPVYASVDVGLNEAELPPAS